MSEGRESPPPERQTGRQLHDPPAQGFGTTEVGDKGEEMQKELRRLSSNPEAPMDKYLKEKFSRTTGNPCGDHVQ